MPSGFTSELHDGKNVSFEDFTMKCARAFGALAHLRDNQNAEIPLKFELEPYYAEYVEENKARLETLKAMSDSDIEKLVKDDYFREKNSLIEGIAKKHAIEKSYRGMLDQVKAWVPPTEEHNGLRDFMIEQLESSLDFDCDTSYYANRLNTLKIRTVDEYRADVIRSAEGSLKISLERLESAENGVAEKNQWLADLRESLVSAR